MALLLAEENQPERLSAMTIPLRTSPNLLPLSFSQQRLWFLEQLTPKSSAYNMAAAVRLHGELDQAALHAALDEIVLRHEVLRVHFATYDGEPVQVLDPVFVLPWQVTDLSMVDPVARDAQLLEVAQAEAATPFDLATGPLLRVRLVRLDTNDHALLLTLHHIIADGWSMGVLVEEIAALYPAYAQGEHSPLPALPVQYADFSAWQRQRLSGAVLEQQLAYWTAQLAHAPVLLALPTDRPRSAVASHRGAALSFVIDAAGTAGLRAMARDERATLFMVLAASFAALLARYTAQDDLCIGTPVANRTVSEVQGMIGLFVNTVVLRTRVDRADSFRELVRHVREVASGAYAHQDLPFEQLVDALRPERHTSYHPLFQVLLTLQNTPQPALTLPGLTLDMMELEVTTAKFDLNLTVDEVGQQLHASFEYNADLFEHDTVARMVAHFKNLLDAMLASPDLPLARLSMLATPERQQLLADWNATASDYPREETLHGLFAARVLSAPDAIALIHGERRLSYRALNEQANRLAHYLRLEGVGPCCPVALCLERGPELIVAMLAVLKAGGTYVPLDPDHPAARLNYVLDDTGAALLLTQQSHEQHVTAGRVPVLSLDSIATAAALAAMPATDPVADPGVGAHALAYIMYTSGSTGQPKGVMVSHRNVVKLILGAGTVPVTSTDTIVYCANPAFDASTWEIWAGLLHGARLLIVPHETLLSPSAFGALLDAHEASIVQLTAGLFHQYSATLGPVLSRLKFLLFGGDKADSNLVTAFAAEHAPAHLLHTYGPTETIAFTTMYEVQATAQARRYLPIGRSLPNSTVYVLDSELQPVPVGLTGELFIGGDGVAQGYLNRPGLTAERFIPDPFSACPGARLYCSGDMARYLADGNVVLLGRRDQQLKIRGFRIELGEISAALSALPDVSDAIVVSNEDPDGERTLAAYVVAEPQTVLDAAMLRMALARTLPGYMIPSSIMVLDALPLTPNGKVDRKALPAVRLDHDGPFTAPRTPVQEIIAGIWRTVLRCRAVGTDDDFFKLGGHSLLATRVIAALRDAFGVEVPLRALFDGPTVAELAHAVEDALGNGATAGRVVAARVRDSALPLSFAQQRLWFLHQLDPTGGSYNMPAALRLTGELDVGALTATVDLIVARHESLRTSFEVHDGVPVQVIAPELKLVMPFSDLGSLTPAQRELRLQELAQEHADTPFELHTGPLIRVALVRLGSHEHVILFTLHHIITDAWSMEVLLREVASLYPVLVQGATPALPALPLQYADFACWQRQWLTESVLEQQLAFWEQTLAGAPALLALPTDRPRPPVQAHRGATLPFEIDSATVSALRSLSQQNQATLFMTLTAAFSAFLARCTGMDDICIGTPTAGRQRSETEALIGFFVNTLVLRTKVDGAASFVDLLRQTRTSALAAYAHQDVPFEHLVEALKPERNLSYTPLFQVWLVLQHASQDHFELPGLVLEPLAAPTSTAKFDLALTLDDTGDVLLAAFDFNTDLFDHATVYRMAQHFTGLLSAIVAEPGRRLESLPMLGAAERHQILAEFNPAPAVGLAASCAHHLFERHARATPAAIALSYGTEQLSYSDLNGRANQLAAYLRTQGVDRDKLVAICVERSPLAIVAMLAVLKAGGAYLPLDPAYPAERIGTMLKQARPVLLLTEQELLYSLPESEVPLFCLDLQWKAVTQHGTSDLALVIDPEQLAYVIFTSGSTGIPKAAAVRHGGLANMVRAQIDQFGVAPGHRVLQFASFSFDAATSEICMALASGATLCLSTRDRLMPGERLTGTLQEQAINVVTLPPVVLGMLDPACLPALTILVVAGEACPPGLIDQWTSGRRVFNAYGPTEAAVCTTIYPCAAPHASTLPLGRPLPNVQVHILDGALEPVPVGVAGQLYIAGEGLARGYLGQPGATASKFVPNPFTDTAGARMYASGDLARYLANGDIDFLGRIDDQLKLRGFRIEPGEIEAALRGAPGVREALVLLRVIASGASALVAYIVTEPGSEPEPATLRRALAQRLPEYMIPAHFVALQQFPLTPNGKVDRAALPLPDAGAGQRGYSAPHTATQKALAQEWATVLGLSRIGIQDNFFELGGHSLLATQVFSRIRTLFAVDLPLRALFETPTLQGLAARIDEALALTDGGETEAPIEPARRDQPLPLSFAQQRLWLLDQLQPGGTTYNMPIAVRLHGQLNNDALRATLDEVVRRHEVLRTSFVLQGAVLQQVIGAPGPLPLAQDDLSALTPAQREIRADELAAVEAQRPFDLADGPLIRARLVRMDQHDHIMLLTMHHIVSDAWSIGVLVKEIGALYDAYARGEPSALPELPIQYADFASWQREWLSGDVLEEQLGYWRAQLAHAPELLTLPTDRPRPAVPSYRGAVTSFQVPPDTTAALKLLAAKTGSTLFMTLATAFSLLLSRYSGQRDICVGTSIANRNRAEIEPLVGFFINTLVLRTRVQSSDSFRTLLDQVRETTLDAYTHQDVPFEQLVEALNPGRHLSSSPLFQVLLTLQNAPMGPLELSALTIDTISTASGTAKYDLTLDVAESEGELRALFEYNTDLFDAATIERMGRHLVQLLASAVARPDACVGELAMIGEPELAQMLVQWNATDVRFAEGATLHTLFEAQVRRIPDALALSDDREQLTFAQLNGRVNRLAHYLRSQGIGPDMLVALCLERSVDMVVGLLGIIKAGAAYVPLDPAAPMDRLAFLLGDARPALLVSQEEVLDNMPAVTIRTVCLDTDRFDRYPDHDPTPVVVPSNLAYMIYTSGSTGTPKGAAITQQGLANYLQWSHTAYPMRQEQGSVVQLPLVFDATVTCLLTPLTAGKSVQLLSPQSDGAMAGLVDVARRISILKITPAHIDVLCADSSAQAPSAQVGVTVIGGESLLVQQANAWLRAFPGTTIVNEYGPTETVVGCCVFESSAALTGAVVPIGRPIANTRIYILDEDFNPVPVGVAGELCIAGAGLARGYFNRPGLTAEKFVPDPFHGTAGERMYRSGDLARYRADGTIECLGRTDDQIKLRGYRIEPKEIEAALMQLPHVREACVLLREDSPGNVALVAYIVAEDDEHATPIAALRDALTHKLPDYMIPAHFVCLDNLPLTTNGKVDRKALPSPAALERPGARRAPETVTEVALAQIWEDVLQLRDIGAEENFFELGGHSLLAIRLISQIRDAFGLELTPRLIFEQPTIAAMSETIEALILAEVEDISDEQAMALTNTAGTAQ